MKLNVDLCRKILEQVEEHPGVLKGFSVRVEGYDKDVNDYHVRVLFDAGLLEGYDSTSSKDMQYQTVVTHLTVQGHDYLGAVRAGKEPVSFTSTARTKAMHDIASELKELGRSFSPFGIKIDK